MPEFLVTVIIVAAVLIVLLLVSAKCYKKAPPNTAMVITGPTGSKTIIGKGCIIIPIVQRVDYMSLENIQSDFTSRDEIPTKDAINILVDAVANVSVSQDPALMKIAASKFLGYSLDQIKEIITPVFEGNIREIISQTTLRELIQGDKKIFAERVIDNVTPNLRDMGLELTTFNIQNFKDRNGVIDNLGLENTVQISKDASISKANAEKEIAIAKAEALKASNEAQVNTDMEVARRQNELDIRTAELKKAADIKRAEADAAYEIQQETQRRELEITKANANLARQEKEIELKERAVAIKERELEATVKKEADAQKYASAQQAEAALYKTQKTSEAELFERQKKAEAEKFEALQRAEAEKARAEAARYAMENEAAGIRARGEAEAAAIKAKAQAEAEGLMKKADAMAKYGEAAKQDMQLQALKVYFEQLPAIAESIGRGYANVDKIVMYGDDTEKFSASMINNLTQVSEGVSEGLGIDLKSLLAGALGTKLISEAGKNAESPEGK